MTAQGAYLSYGERGIERRRCNAAPSLRAHYDGTVMGGIMETVTGAVVTLDAARRDY